MVMVLPVLPSKPTDPAAAALRTLVVDDDAAAAMALAGHLERLGLNARFATDGEHAIALAIATPPACVFLDLRMPGLSGVQVGMRLRQLFDGNVTLIAMTGADDEAMDYQLMHAICDFVMTKPIDLDQLRALVAPARGD